MEKEIRLSVRIDKELKKEFFELCERNQQTPSKVIKYLIQCWIEKQKALLKND